MAVAVVTVEVVGRIVLSWVNDLREISLSPDFLGVVDLLWGLILRWLVCVIFW